MNNDNSITVKCRQMYEMALKNLERPNPDLADEVIVALWNALALTAQQKLELQSYSKDEQQRRLCDYMRQVDLLELQLTKVTKERDELKFRLEGLEK